VLALQVPSVHPDGPAGVRLPWFASQLAFSPDGGRLAVTVSVAEREKPTSIVKLWDLASGQEVLATEAVSGLLSHLDFSADGKRLVAAEARRGEVKVWDAAAGRELVTQSGKGTLRHLAINRDATRIAVVIQEATDRLLVWNTAPGSAYLEQTEPAGAIRDLALSPDGRQLALALGNPSSGPPSAGEIDVYDLTTYKLRFQLRGHTQTVTTVAFSPDGRRLVSAGGGNFGGRGCEAKLWDAATGHELLNLEGRPGMRLTRLSFSPDSTRLIAVGQSTQGASEAVQVWDATRLPEPTPGVEQVTQTIPGWGDVINSNGDCTIAPTGDKVTVTVPGTVHDLTDTSVQEGRSAPRILRSVEGDFLLQVRVTGDFNPGQVSASPGKTAFNGAGLLLWIDHENYIRLERNIWSEGTGSLRCYPPLFEYWRNGKNMNTNPPAIDASFFKGRSTYLRLERRQGTIRAACSHDGKEWITLPPLDVDLPPTVRVGVAAVNTSREPFTVEFDELKWTTK
jgi:WD40 repeat protein